jgi:hypothetical protein
MKRLIKHLFTLVGYDQNFASFGFVFDSRKSLTNFFSLFVTYVGSDIFLTFFSWDFLKKLGGIQPSRKEVDVVGPFTSSHSNALLSGRQGLQL